eukprot:TRINITY_DN66014_c0_g1_i1.p1 TRINITY_DN66014_c0_g1~~TRINITY_DN66014_c0_g1_i1.p1  ORF type:complete len:309 (+),score=70.31 TRINITY_DN66014_c0_g1_i1:68-994(+)
MLLVPAPMRWAENATRGPRAAAAVQHRQRRWRGAAAVPRGRRPGCVVHLRPAGPPRPMAPVTPRVRVTRRIDYDEAGGRDLGPHWQRVVRMPSLPELVPPAFPPTPSSSRRAPQGASGERAPLDEARVDPADGQRLTEDEFLLKYRQGGDFSEGERRWAAAALPQFALRKVTAIGLCDGRVRFNVLHWSGFEMDIVCRNVNIELDGPQHNSVGSKRMDALRDAFLKKNGITVHRIPLVDSSLSGVIDEISRVLPAGTPQQWKEAKAMSKRGWKSIIRWEKQREAEEKRVAEEREEEGRRGYDDDEDDP